MKTLEFETEVQENETLKLPYRIARRLSAGERVHVVLLSKEDDDWQTLSANQFLAEYNESDAVYDRL
jgi:hypothetical protein